MVLQKVADDPPIYFLGRRSRSEVLSALTVARLQIVAWTRAHQAMAQGVKDPGKFLEIALQTAEKAKQALAL